MLLVPKLAKLAAAVFRNTFRPKFNTHASTGSSICKKVALRLATTMQPTNFYRLIYCIGLRHLGGWARSQKGFKQYCPWRLLFG